MKKTASLCNGIPGPTDCAGTIASRELHHSVASMTFHPMKALYPVLIKIICLPVLAAFCQSATGVPGSVNLLHGDVSFELGAYGWEAHTGPWKSTELDNNYRAKGLRDGSAEGVIDTSSPYRGKAALRLQLAPESRSYVTASLPVDLDPGRYTLSAFVRCSETTRVQLRTVLEYPAGKEGGQNDFYDAHARSESQAGTEWRRATLSFDIKTRTRLVPVIDFFGARGQCWTDDVALTVGTEPAPDPLPQRIVQRLQIRGDFPGPMPNLIIANGDWEQKNVTIALETLVPSSQAGNARVEFRVQDGDDLERVVTTQNVNLTAAVTTLTSFDIPIRPNGIWKISATTFLPDETNHKIETVFASISMSDDNRDVFFGTHQKLSPVVTALGFGAIRDMHLLRWASVMPARDKIATPTRDELTAIKRFVDSGGTYLATVVSEQPARIGYNASHWGTLGEFGGVPVWADSGRDTSAGVLGQTMRKPMDSAIEKYATYVARNYPYLEFEFMNEPLHYLTPHEYTHMLKIFYRTVKKENPQALVAGFASPPNWFLLPNGKDSKRRGARPLAWFEEAFSQGAADAMDVISVHTYDRALKKEVPEKGYIADGQAAWAQSVKALATENGQSLPVWITEKGITSPSWRESRRFRSGSTNHRTEKAITQARWIIRSQIDALSHGVERFYLWNQPWGSGSIHRFFPNEDIRYTLFDSDGLPRLALVAQRTLILQLANTDALESGRMTKTLFYSTFRGKDGEKIVLWQAGDSEDHELQLEPIKIKCASTINNKYATNLFGSKKKIFCEEHLSITPSPTFIETGGSGSSKKTVTELRNLFQPKQ